MFTVLENNNCIKTKVLPSNNLGILHYNIYAMGAFQVVSIGCYIYR